MIARWLVAVVALAAAVVLGADLRSTRAVDAAVADAGARPTPAVVRRSAAELRDVAAGTRDTAPLLREAQIELGVRDFRAALAAAQEAARREPENAQAWLLVGFAAAGAKDRAAAAEARRRIGRLVARP